MICKIKILDLEPTENQKLLPPQINVRSDQGIASIETHSEPINMLPVPSKSQIIKKPILASSNEDHISSRDLPEKSQTFATSPPAETSPILNGK